SWPPVPTRPPPPTPPARRDRRRGPRRPVPTACRSTAGPGGPPRRPRPGTPCRAAARRRRSRRPRRAGPRRPPRMPPPTRQGRPRSRPGGRPDPRAPRFRWRRRTPPPWWTGWRGPPRPPASSARAQEVFHRELVEALERHATGGERVEVDLLGPHVGEALAGPEGRRGQLADPGVRQGGVHLGIGPERRGPRPQDQVRAHAPGRRRPHAVQVLGTGRLVVEVARSGV